MMAHVAVVGRRMDKTHFVILPVVVVVGLLVLPKVVVDQSCSSSPPIRR